MARTFGLKTSRVLDVTGKSLDLLVARSGKAITDTEGVTIQDIQALKLAEFVNASTYSGCVDLPPYRIVGSDDPQTLPSSTLVIPPFRAIVGSNSLLVQGSNNLNAPANFDNYVSLPGAPSTGYGVCVIYLEAWYQVLDEDPANSVTSGFYLPTGVYQPGITPRFYYPYGNILANPGWIQTQTTPGVFPYIDDLRDPIIGYTSGRVQMQYALRVGQILPGAGTGDITNYIKDFVMTHPSLLGKALYTAPSPGPFVFQGPSDPGLYVSTGSYRNSDSSTYAIPLAVVFQRNRASWTPCSNPFGAGGLGGVSGRPDGKYFDVLTLDDVIDTRSSVLAGTMEDYESVVRQAANRLWQGTLRLKIAEADTSEPTAHQVGPVLTSQEIIGPYLPASDIIAPTHIIAQTDEPRTSWVSDSFPETLTYYFTPSTKDTSENSVTTNWADGDTVTITLPYVSAQITALTVYTFNSTGQILKVPPAYLSVSGLGSSTIETTLTGIGSDIRFVLTNPLWFTISISRRTGSIQALRHVPVGLNTPIHYINGGSLPCGRVSDYAASSEDSQPLNKAYPLRSYKRGFKQTTFGTVRVFKVPITSMASYNTTDPSISTSLSPGVSFTQGNAPVEASSVQLSWSTSNSVRATLTSQVVSSTTVISLGDIPLSGSISVRVTEPTIYTINAYNQKNDFASQTITVTPFTDLVAGKVTSGLTVGRAFPYPGGALNPENVFAEVSETSINIPLDPGFGNPLNNVMLGCLKATYHYIGLDGSYQQTDLQIHHQHVAGSADNLGVVLSKVGVFGDLTSDINPNNYIEFEFLVTNLKTFHFNPTVKGISSVAETVCPSANGYLYFSPSQTTATTNYSFTTYPDYIHSALNCIVSSTAKICGESPTSQQNCFVGGCFEGIFGFNDQAFVFVLMNGDSFYRTVPCTVTGLGTSLIKINIPSISNVDVVDVMVLAQTTTILEYGSTALLSYDYVPYQGEGSTAETYTLTHLSNNALVTTFGTGGRVIPGIASTGAVNSYFPISPTLPAVSGWDDSSLVGARFEVSGSYSGVGSSADSTTDLVETPLRPTMSGNIETLFQVSSSGGVPLAPRTPTERGFSSNVVGFTYAITPPVFGLESSNPTANDITYYVDILAGNDSASGLTRATAKRSLQKLLDALPSEISQKILINVNGTATVSDATISLLNFVNAVPYGHPELDQLYAIIRSEFNTVGDGVVIVQKDPILTDFLNISVPDVGSLSAYPIFGWIHLKGNLILRGINFSANQGTCFAAYPGSKADISLCNFYGGTIQLLVYGASVAINGISFSNALANNIITTSGGTVTSGDSLSFTKGAATGYTLTVEKGSTFLVNKPFSGKSGYPIVPRTEILVQQYSTFDTSPTPTFSFSVGRIRLTTFSTLIYNTTKWFSTLLDTDTEIDILPADNVSTITGATPLNPMYLIINKGSDSGSGGSTPDNGPTE